MMEAAVIRQFLGELWREPAGSFHSGRERAAGCELNRLLSNLRWRAPRVGDLPHLAGLVAAPGVFESDAGRKDDS